MKPKQIFILAVIFALLIAGIVLKKTQQRPELATEEYTPLEMTFNADQVVKITISKQKAGDPQAKPQVELIKENGVWKIPGLWGARADQDKIPPFLNEIKKAKGELRGKSKEVFSDFGISDQEGFQVDLEDASGKEILGFVIGSKKADYGTLFVRKKNSEAVYLTEAALFAQMGVFGKPELDEPQPDYWALKKYASFEPAKVSKIERLKFQNGAQSSSFTLEKEGGAWKFSDKDFPFSPDLERVFQYLSGIRNNQAEKVLDPKAKDYGFQKPRWQFRLTLESGNPVEFTVGDADTKEEGAFYLQASGEPVVFLISKYYVENMTVDADWFVSNNPLGADNTKIERLVIHADKTEKTFQPLVKKWDALTSYMDGLKNFKMEKPAGGKAKFGKYWLEIKKQDELESMIIDVAAAPVVSGEEKFYPAQKRGTPYVFFITPVLFSQLFDNLSRLDEPK